LHNFQSPEHQPIKLCNSSFGLTKSDCVAAKGKSMEMKLSLAEAKQRALEFMYRGYH
jgi:hypothetical protein